MTVVKKSKSKADANYDVNNIKEEYIKLTKNYQNLLKNAQNFHRQNSFYAKDNARLVNEELKSRRTFVESTKLNLLAFLIRSSHFDVLNEFKIEAYISQRQYVITKAFEYKIQSNNTVDGYTHDEEVQAEAAFSSITTQKNFLTQVLKFVVESLNKKFFAMDFDCFYAKLTAFFLKDQLDEQLSTHSNFSVLKDLKKTYDQIVQIWLCGHISSPLNGLQLEGEPAVVNSGSTNIWRQSAYGVSAFETASVMSLENELILEAKDDVCSFKSDFEDQ